MNRLATATAALLIMGVPAYAQTATPGAVPVEPETAIGVQERRALEIDRGEVGDPMRRLRRPGEVTGTTDPSMQPGGVVAEPDTAIEAIERQEQVADEDQRPLTTGEQIGRDDAMTDIPATGAVGAPGAGPVAEEPDTAAEVLQRRRLLTDEDQIQPGGQTAPVR